MKKKVKRKKKPHSKWDDRKRLEKNKPFHGFTLFSLWLTFVGQKRKVGKSLDAKTVRKKSKKERKKTVKGNIKKRPERKGLLSSPRHIRCAKYAQLM